MNRNGDLLSNIYFVFNLPDIYSPYDPVSNTSYKFRWIKNIGTNIINSVQLVIGGSEIDKQYGEWLEVWNELTIPEEKLDGYNKMIGNVTGINLI